ncbi:TerB family tellurite resistance protein [Acidovorax delafieldii]|uniref:tellurite resistance TerB family protein n=1 Tax=Acidovorax delafieldii TaxID=47920 RepID=UPI003ECDFC94
MFQALKDLLESLTPFNPVPSPAERARSVQLAAAVLLVEVVRTQSAVGDAERSVMQTALHRQFALSDDELQRLLEQAAATSRTAYDYQRFTSQLNEHFTQDEKIQLVEAMWQVAYADARPDENEMHTISKVAGLLHVTHGEYIGAKLRAKETAHAGHSPH